MTLEWWERTDRAALIRAARELVPVGGLLIVEGDDRAGRNQAARLVEHALDELGLTVTRYRDTTTSRPVEACLLELCRDLEGPAPVGVLAGAVLATRRGPLKLAERAAGHYGAEFRVVIFEEVDPSAPISPQEVFALRRLGQGALIVVTSRKESGSTWGNAPSGQRQALHALTQFSKADLVESLRRSPHLAMVEDPELDAIADTLVAASGANRVDAMDAYSVLGAL